MDKSPSPKWGFSKDKKMSAITPKAKAPKEAPVLSPSIGAEYQRLILAGFDSENAKTDFNSLAVTFIKWLDVQTESVRIKQATLKDAAKDLTFNMPVRFGHVQSTGTACLILAKYGDNQKASDVLTLAKKIDTIATKEGAGAFMDAYDTIENGEDENGDVVEGLRSACKSKSNDDAGDDAPVKASSVSAIFQKTIKELGKVKDVDLKLEELDIQLLTKLNALIHTIATNSGLKAVKK